MKEIKDLTLQEVQEILEKEAERGKSFNDENLRYLNEIVITKERKRFNGIMAFLKDCKKYDMMRIKDGIEPVVFTENIKENDASRKIDYIFTSSHFETKSIEVYQSTASDHMPYIAHLELGGK